MSLEIKNKTFSGYAVKKELAIDTTFDPPWFSLDYTLKYHFHEKFILQAFISNLTFTFFVLKGDTKITFVYFQKYFWMLPGVEKLQDKQIYYFRIDARNEPVL